MALVPWIVSAFRMDKSWGSPFIGAQYGESCGNCELLVWKCRFFCSCNGGVAGCHSCACVHISDTNSSGSQVICICEIKDWPGTVDCLEMGAWHTSFAAKHSTDYARNSQDGNFRQFWRFPQSTIHMLHMLITILDGTGRRFFHRRWGGSLLIMFPNRSNPQYIVTSGNVF